MSTRYDEPEPGRPGRQRGDPVACRAGDQHRRDDGRCASAAARPANHARVVINLLTVDGVDYVVSPRGNTQWARNVRAAGVVEIGPRWRRRRDRDHRGERRRQTRDC